jgi:hypothetical protein
MPVFLSGYDPIKMLEVLLNTLMAKGILSKAEVERIVAAGKAPK